MYKQAGSTYLNVQTGYGVTEDIKVREAISYAINKDEIAMALDNVVTPLYGFISEAQAGFSASKEAEFATTYAFDQGKAKSLLADAGWMDSDSDGILDKDGETLTIEMLTSTDRATINAAAPVIQVQLQAVGIDLQITEYESSYIKQMMKDDDYTMGTRNFVWNDADILYYVFTGNSGYIWDDAEVTAALEEARYVVDPSERVKAYEDVQELLVPLMKGVSLFADNYCVATKKDVSGLIITNDGRTFVNDLIKE
jgi:peptide/nickel transport system substrate-binding protein